MVIRLTGGGFGIIKVTDNNPVSATTASEVVGQWQSQQEQKEEEDLEEED